MNEDVAARPASSTLYLRMAEESLCFARYEACRTPRFDFSVFAVAPRTSLTVNLREAFSTEDILRHPVNKVVALVAGPVTPVPLADFQEEDCEAFYNYCFPAGGRRRVFYDVVPAANAVLLFALEEATCRTLEDAFGAIHYVACQTPVMRHFSAKGAGPGKRCFVHTHEGHIDVAVYDEGRLVMCNTYRTREPADAAYYVCSAAVRLGLDCAAAPFYVAGLPDERDSVTAELRKYAAGVYTVNPVAEYNRHKVAATPGVPYDLMTFLLDI